LLSMECTPFLFPVLVEVRSYVVEDAAHDLSE